MSEVSGTNNSHHAISIEEGNALKLPRNESSENLLSLLFLQKLVAELLGTYFMIFAGCTAVVINIKKDSVITHPGVSITWGLVVMVMVYSLGHISGAHFNPAVTIAHTACKRFPLKQVPAYIFVQVIGSTLASGTVRLLFGAKQFPGTIPAGSDMQSLVLEFIITFFLMFVISGVSTDDRAVGELAGIAVGAVIVANIIFSGQTSGASMNPARSLGPAFIYGRYDSLWVYLVGPTLGALAGAGAYSAIRTTNKPVREITKSGSFLKSSAANGSI
ncbi:hypothetical protein IFM89_016816 [Coptis chinensis]|uniref:Uncharacterized protein n=1 Tax=Coptis chinensis TaxID=261450 RepID=A0A835H168_9MAGN|nr:hypothetical protein IFM89_016816 [Coptis chinensis]